MYPFSDMSKPVNVDGVNYPLPIVSRDVKRLPTGQEECEGLLVAPEPVKSSPQKKGNAPSKADDTDLDPEEYYPIEKIVDKRLGKNGVIEYYLKWYGYDSSHNSWVPEDELDGCDHFIADFNASQVNPSNDIDFDPEEYYPIEKIVDKRLGKNGVIEYYLKWGGYDSSHNSWIPADDLDGCDNLIADFNASQVNPSVDRNCVTVSGNINGISDKINGVNSSSDGSNTLHEPPVNLHTNPNPDAPNGKYSSSGAMVNAPCKPLETCIIDGVNVESDGISTVSSEYSTYIENGLVPCPVPENGGIIVLPNEIAEPFDESIISVELNDENSSCNAMNTSSNQPPIIEIMNDPLNSSIEPINGNIIDISDESDGEDSSNDPMDVSDTPHQPPDDNINDISDAMAERLKDERSIEMIEELGWEADHIVGALEVCGHLAFFIKWKGVLAADVILAREANIRWPQVVIQFYEQRLSTTGEVFLG